MHIAINTLPGTDVPFPHHVVRYLSQVVERIQKEKPSAHFSCLHVRGEAPAFPELPPIETDPPGSGFFARLGRTESQDSLLKQHAVDLILSPLQTALGRTALPQVLLALDVAPWEDRNGPQLSVKEAKRACASAAYIITPTEQLRRQCLELFEAPMEKIVVAPPGVAVGLDKAAGSLVEKPYIVMFYDPLTAALLKTLRAALDKRREEFPFTQVIVGPTLPEEPDQWGPGVVRIEQCPANHLAGLYREAAFFLYAAPHDGCGLRVLEALAAGVPVLAAGSRGVSEVAGNAPIYFNGESLDAFFQSLKRILSEDGQSRAKRIQTGKQTAGRYSWDKTMWKVLSTFKAG